MRQSRQETTGKQLGRSGSGPAWVLIAVFMLTIVLVPLLQQLYELTTRPEQWHLVRIIDIPIAGARAWLDPAGGGPRQRLLAGNAAMLERIDSWENELEEVSIAGHRLRPKAQTILSGLRAGNQETYCGRNGWLFLRKAVDHLTGPGFLDPRGRHLRTTGDKWQRPVQPDPRPAIIDFHRQLAERGIELIVMPVPVKASVHPEHLSRRFDGKGPTLHNRSFPGFMEELRQAGITIYDPSSTLLRAKHDSGAQYLKTDSHWRPEAVELVAEELAVLVRQMVDLPPVWAPQTDIEEGLVTGYGDLAGMLELAPNHPSYLCETVLLHQVTTPDSLWAADAKADLLFLGDSFTNIYSFAAMGGNPKNEKLMQSSQRPSWGESAGIIEHLGHRLQRPLDAIVHNHDGAFATRLVLSRELAQGRDRLAGKRLVIWQMSARELSFGDWRRLPMTLGRKRPARFVTPPPAATWLVTGTIAAKGRVPRARSAPYADMIVALHLVDLESDQIDADAAEAMVYVRAMQGFVWQSGARYRLGQRLTLELQAWTEVADQLATVNRSEIYDVELGSQVHCWGEEPKP